MNAICANCKYFKRFADETKGFFAQRTVQSIKGRCWRFPPMVVVYGELWAAFGDSEHPQVKVNDYCGEFTEK